MMFELPPDGEVALMYLLQHHAHMMLGTERGYKIISRKLEMKEISADTQIEIVAEQGGPTPPPRTKKAAPAQASSAPLALPAEMVATSSAPVAPPAEEKAPIPPKTVIIIFGAHSAAIKDAAHFRKYVLALPITYPQTEEVILLTRNNLSKTLQESINQWALEQGIYLVLLRHDKLIPEWSPTNPYYSHHVRVPDAEWQRVADERKITKNSFPNICYDDTGVLYSTARPGDIVECKIKSETAVYTTVWKYVTSKSCVPPDM